MKNIENLRKEELSNEKLRRICGGESTDTTDTDTANTDTATTTTSNTKIVNVGNSIVDDLNGLIR